MKKLFFVFLLLFLASCLPMKARLPFSAGSQGLAMEFVEKAPPESVYESTPIPFVLKLSNMGTADINNGYIAFGVDPYIDLVSNPLSVFSLAGRSQYNLEGETQYLNIIANAKVLDPQSQLRSAEVRVTACYPYKTRASVTVCIDALMYNPQVQGKVCDVGSVKLSAHSAPVGVVRVDTNMIPLPDDMIQPEFIIYIENLGNGLIVDALRVADACTGFNLGTAFNTLKVSARLPNQVLSCDRELKLQKNGGNFVRCTGIPLDLRSGTYPTQLTIELDYGYVHSISKIVKILNK